MTGIPSYSTTAANNVNANTGITWDEGMAPAGVNDAARQNMADTRAAFNDLIWFAYGKGDTPAYTPVYVSGTQFKIAGVDVSAIYHVGRRVKVVGSSTGTIYGTISAVSFSTDTTVTVAWDSGSLSNEVFTAVYISQAAVTGRPISPDAIDISNGVFSGKNRTINGDMRIDQRNAGASQTYTAGAAIAYNVDRFYGSCTGANVTGQQVAGPTGYQYAYKYTGAASVTAILHGHRYESKNVADLVNKNVAFSVVLANSLLTTVTWTAYYANSTDNFSAKTQIATGTFTGISSTAAVYTAVFNAGANAANGIAVEISVGAQTSGTWNITGWQLEEAPFAATTTNPVATPFERRDYASELARCQRYAYPLVGGFSGYANGTTVVDCAVNFPVPMRGVPSVVQGTNLGIALPGSAVQSSQSITLPNNITQYGGTIRFNNFTGLTSGAFVTLTPNNTTTFQTAYFAMLTAEL